MANRIEPFDVTVPAGTQIATFAKFPLTFRDGRVDRLEVRVPPGPSGLMGFRIAHSGQSVIPYTGVRWIVADNEHLDWELNDYPTGGAWEIWAYNLDVYEHVIYLRFHVTEIGSAPVPVEAPISITPIAEPQPEEQAPEQFVEPQQFEVPFDSAS